jgi:hypothetical protein
MVLCQLTQLLRFGVPSAAAEVRARSLPNEATKLCGIAHISSRMAHHHGSEVVAQRVPNDSSSPKQLLHLVANRFEVGRVLQETLKA